MEKSQKLWLLPITIALLLQISGCFGGSKGPSENNETPVQVGNEDSLALPPE